jgi:hypothetical protein
VPLEGAALAAVTATAGTGLGAAIDGLDEEEDEGNARAAPPSAPLGRIAATLAASSARFWAMISSIEG